MSSIVLWSLLFLIRSLLLILLGFPCMGWVILLLLIFFLFVVFIILILMYLGLDLFAFFLLGGCWASWMCQFVFFFNRFGKFSAIISVNIFLPFFALLVLPLWVCRCNCWCPTLFWVSAHFSSPLFSFYSLGYITCISLSSSSLILSFASLNILLSPVLNFSFQL